MRANHVKRNLKAGGVSIGTMVYEFVSPGLPRILAEAGAEFVIYDAEHTWFSAEQLGYLIASSRATSMTPCVRVADMNDTPLSRPLDMGATGIMVPHVDTRAEAEELIRATKYPPLGERGVAATMANDDYTGGDVSKKLQSANEETLVIVQIESAMAIDNLEAIVSVPGVDVAWVGHFDLSVSMGIPGQFEHPGFQSAIDRVVEVSARHGVAAGVMQNTPAAARAWMDRGYRAISYSGDIWLLQDALRDGIQRLRDG